MFQSIPSCTKPSGDERCPSGYGAIKYKTTEPIITSLYFCDINYLLTTQRRIAAYSSVSDSRGTRANSPIIAYLTPLYECYTLACKWPQRCGKSCQAPRLYVRGFITNPAPGSLQSQDAGLDGPCTLKLSLSYTKPFLRPQCLGPRGQITKPV
jgi:hypothetical protein